MRIQHLIAAALLAVCVPSIAGCGTAHHDLQPGEYAGSTHAQKAVTVDVGNNVLLDGVAMRRRPDGSWVATHDPRTSMRCHMALHDTEMFCAISRDGARETVEMLKL